MATIYDSLYFENTLFKNVTDPKEKEILLKAAEKLKPLEQQILGQPSGKIKVRRSAGTDKGFFTTGYTDYLAERILEALKH